MKIHKKKIEKKIDKLSSTNPLERINTAYELGKFGRKAASAIPFLIEILGDNRFIECPPQWVNKQINNSDMSKDRITSPGEEAAKALSKMGDLSIEYLLSSLKNIDQDVRINVLKSFGYIGDEKLLEPISSLLHTNNIKIRKVAIHSQ